MKRQWIINNQTSSIKHNQDLNKNHWQGTTIAASCSTTKYTFMVVIIVRMESLTSILMIYGFIAQRIKHGQNQTQQVLIQRRRVPKLSQVREQVIHSTELRESSICSAVQMVNKTTTKCGY